MRRQDLRAHVPMVDTNSPVGGLSPRLPGPGQTEASRPPLGQTSVNACLHIQTHDNTTHFSQSLSVLLSKHTDLEILDIGEVLLCFIVLVPGNRPSF
jgi:hypothetical protein